jgi:hypothetical protein
MVTDSSCKEVAMCLKERQVVERVNLFVPTVKELCNPNTQWLIADALRSAALSHRVQAPQCLVSVHPDGYMIQTSSALPSTLVPTFIRFVNDDLKSVNQQLRVIAVLSQTAHTYTLVMDVEID